MTDATKWREVKGWRFAETQGELYTCLPGKPEAFPSHAHEEYQLYLNHALAYRYRYRGGGMIAPPHRVVAFHSGEAHSGEDVAARESVSAFRLLYLSLRYLQSAASEIRGKPVTSPPFLADAVIDDETLAALFVRAHQALADGSTLEQETRLLLLTRRLLRHARVSPAAPPPRTGGEAIAVAKARVFLEDNFDRNVSLETLAQEVCLSPYYLHRAFRQRVGMPPHAYQINVRVGRAKSLLMAGESPGQVAARIGFADQSHFTRNFRRFVGVTPKRYAAAK